VRIDAGEVFVQGARVGVNFESLLVSGTQYDDRLTGGSRADTFRGRDGNDTL
jgi:Ca2+-binding RTX toxin-like protein